MKIQPAKFQVVCGTGELADSLVAIRKVKTNGKHQVWIMKPNGIVLVTDLVKPLFFSSENAVKPSKLLAKFCVYLRTQGGCKGLEIWFKSKTEEGKLVSRKGWIAVDLDGTLAHYDGWRGISHIGTPINEMTVRVMQWLCKGYDVRIFTARVCTREDDNKSISVARKAIEDWSENVFDLTLPVTNVKDFGMIQLWDDKCIQVVKNTGIPVKGDGEAVTNE